MDYSIGTSVLENWRIVRFLGEGANGKVFEIHKTDHGVTAKSALKVMRVPRSESDIRAALSEGMDQRSVTTYFQGVVDEIVKEIALMAELKSHPAIVSCEDYQVIDHPGEIGWDILIRMELLTALPDYQMNSPLGAADVLRMGRELCGALVYCQKKGLIHRDVKPENIFVNELAQFKLGDFGVARTVEKTTGGLSKKGTESYMAPEVYLGRPYGGSVDIYSLGLVLYKFLNKGRLPFFPAWSSPITFADRENALSARMQGKAFPYPCDASDSFARVILKACAYDPKERYRTAAEFLEALNQVELPQNAGKADASGSLADTLEIYTDEKTMGMYGSPDAEEKTVGMYGSPDAEGKTVGMYGSPGAEEKTSGAAGNTAASRAESKESARQPSQPPEQEKPINKTRKTAPWIMAAAAIAIIAIAVFMQLNKKYQVTVANGSGAGAYKAGEEVTLTAEDRSAEDMVFTGWEVTAEDVELSDASSETCSFLMPEADVEIKATFEKVYHVTVSGGSGSGTYRELEVVALAAEDRSAEDLEFSGWEVTKGEVILGDDEPEKCGFFMPDEDVEVAAQYTPKKHNVKVIDGDGEGEYIAGDEVTIHAVNNSKDQQVFAGWKVTKGEVSLSDASAETCSFLMPRSDVEIEAIFKRTSQVTVTDGSGSGTYKEGEVVTLEAKDRSAEDLTFYCWSIDKGGVILSDIYAEDCQFTMRNSEVEISAVYKEKLQLKWESVIDRLMEPDAWTSIDGRTNYAEFSEEDWDTYQANYKLAIEESYDEYIMPVLPVKEYAEREDGYTHLFLYDMIDNEDYYSKIYVFGEGTDVESISFNQSYSTDARAKVRLTDPGHWRNGLYPKCGGIYLDETYDAALKQLGITEEMLAWLPLGDSEYRDDEYRVQSFSGYHVYFKEDQEYIDLTLKKKAKEIYMSFDYDENGSYYYLDELKLYLR